MKFQITILATCLFASVSNAQPALSSEDFYLPGDAVMAYDVSTDGLDDGPDGVNQIWDFSNVEVIQPSSIWSGVVMHPNTVNDFAYFPDANVALVQENGNIRYWRNDTYGLSQSGQGGDNEILTLNAPFNWITYPFTMGSNSSQDAAGTIFSSCRDYTWQGSSQSQGVGYGTLVLPTGTFQDVLKVRRISFTSKSSAESGIDRENSIIEHFWFKPGIRGPLMYMRSWSNNGCPGSNSGSEAAYILPNNATTNVQPVHPSGAITLQLFPNPAFHQTQLNIRSSEKTIGMIWISDMIGQPVMRISNQEAIEKSHIQSIDLNSLQPGMYIVNVKTENQHYTEKLIIQ